MPVPASFPTKCLIESFRVIGMTVSPPRPKARHVLWFLCAACTALLLACPRPAIEAVREALRLCCDTIIPSLFPFLVLSALLTGLAPLAQLEALCSPLMGPLFHLSGSSAAVLALGFTGGYPVGVRTAAELYREGRLGRAETERLLAFCNNSGPGFLVGVMGVGVFGSSAAGVWLYGIHILSALLVGLLFRFYGSPRENEPRRSAAPSAAPPKSLPHLFSDAVTGSFLAVLNICAFVLFFMIALRLLSFTGLLHLLAAGLELLPPPFGMPESLATALLAGILELSTGAGCLQGAPLTAGTAALASFLLGWGGLSVHCQSLIFLLDARLNCKTYLLGKGLQAIISAILAYVLFRLLL